MGAPGATPAGGDAGATRPAERRALDARSADPAPLAGDAPIAVPAATRVRPVWLHVGTLLDGTSTVPRHDAHVVYDAGSIRFVGDAGRTPPRELLRPGQDAPDLSAPDVTLLPGLVEAHAHLFLEGGELDAGRRAAYLEQPPATLLDAARARLERLVRLGIAGIRDAGDRLGVGLALRRLYLGGPRPLMPYLDSPGAAIHHRGRYGGFMAEPLEDHDSPAAAVAARVAAGADRIKLIPTGIIDFRRGRVTASPQMSTAEVAALVAAARGHARQTFAHASGDVGIGHAIEGGVDSVEHGFFLRADQLARMRDLRTAWVPTFVPVQAQVEHADRLGWDSGVVDHLRAILDAHASSLRRAHELGVPILAGSDAGSYGVAHGPGLLAEMELLEVAGLPSLAVVNAATGVPSGRLAFREPFGRVHPGYRSRIILTRHTPLHTVANLRRPRTVVFDGAVFRTTDIDPEGL